MRSAHRTAFLLSLALACLSQQALACTSANVSVDVSNAGLSDASRTTYIHGFVDNGCTGTIAVTVTIVGVSAEGTPLTSGRFTFDNVPAGGRSFELVSPGLYHESVNDYRVEKLDVSDVGPNADPALDSSGQPRSLGTNQRSLSSHLVMGRAAY